MSTPGGGPTSGAALALTTALTTWVTMLSWRGFSVEPGRYLVPLLLAALTVALLGEVLRRLRVPALVVVAGQAMAAWAFVAVSLSGSPVPTGARWDTLVDSIEAAAAAARTYAAPVPAAADSIHPLLLPLGVGCLVLVDVIACTWRRVPLAGLVLLAVYSIPVSLLDGQVSWWIFAGSAAGFLVMLFLHADEQVSRWGRPLGQPESAADPSAFGVRTGSIRRSALGIGGAATALAVVLPAFIPTLDLGLISGGSGPGRDEVTIENPIADLRRDLQRGDDVPLLRLTTDDPRPEYLRVASLTVFTNNEWRAGTRKIPADQRAQGGPLTLPGVGPSVTRAEFDYEVSAHPRFDSRWLPTTSQVSRVEAAGDWRYDRETMDFFAYTDGLDTAGLTWSMTGVRLGLTAVELAAAPAAGSDLDRFTELPEDLPRSVRDLAVEVTAGEPTRYQRAVRLQQWFRTDGGFRYDLATAEGNGADALVAFLDDRVGYCEQFASAMAVMARSLGIPARVSVGFLRPDRVGADTWEYSAWDMHAWPELYFEGYGWVRFEPTPATRANGVPPYTRQRVPEPTGGASDSAGAQPSEELPDRGSPSSAEVAPDSASGSDGDSGAGAVWRRLLLGVLAVAGALGLALIPRTVRGARRERRWAGGGRTEDAWAELRDTVVDVGRTWPVGLSPRAAGDRVATWFGRPVDDLTPDRPATGAEVDPSATAALDRIVAAVEVERYARPGAAGPAGLRADVETCAGALLGGVTRAARRRAAWLPRSVLRRTSGGASQAAGYDEAVDHAG